MATVELKRVYGVSQERNVWWKFGKDTTVSCPQCGYLQTYSGRSTDAPFACRGCGKTTTITLLGAKTAVIRG